MHPCADVIPQLLECCASKELRKVKVHYVCIQITLVVCDSVPPPPLLVGWLKGVPPTRVDAKHFHPLGSSGVQMQAAADVRRMSVVVQMEPPLVM